MIEILSSWAKGLGLTIVIVSIFEMLLPNNNSKKYIKMVLGIYVIFNIISPLVTNKEVFSLDNINLEDYQTAETTVVNQTSMDERIKELYEQELEKDIIEKIEEKGYEVTDVKVDADISNEEESKINKIKLNIRKTQEKQEIKENTTENKIVTEIQKIKKVDTTIKTDKNEEEKTETKKEDTESISKIDIQNVKKFLIEEYGVSEKCLEIN